LFVYKRNKLFKFETKFKPMKAIKMLVVSGIIASMSAYAQDGGKQAPKKEEEKSKNAPKQEVTIKTKSSNVKEEKPANANKEAKPAAEPKKEEKKTNAPH
jgi:stringent starvation protein B